jgi:hypothetical protein
MQSCSRYSSSSSSSAVATLDDLDVERPFTVVTRAGVRVVVGRHEPPKLFAAVEMAVLVLVTSLAMVAVILTSTDDANAAGRHPAFAKAEIRPASPH